MITNWKHCFADTFCILHLGRNINNEVKCNPEGIKKIVWVIQSVVVWGTDS